MRLSDGRIANFILNNPGSLVKADIDTEFNLCFGKKFNSNDLPKRKMIRDFLVGISCVKDMIISSSTLEFIYDYSRCEPLPLFSNLSSLRVEFTDYRWEMLPSAQISNLLSWDLLDIKRRKELIFYLNLGVSYHLSSMLR